MKWMICVALMGVAIQMNAQSMEEQSIDTVDKASKETATSAITDSTFCLSDIHVTKVNITDKGGKDWLNPDGTKQVFYLLMDENGEIICPECQLRQVEQVFMQAKGIIKESKGKTDYVSLRHQKKLIELVVKATNQQKILKAYDETFNDDSTLKDITTDPNEVMGMGKITEITMTVEEIEKVLDKLEEKESRVNNYGRDNTQTE